MIHTSYFPPLTSTVTFLDETGDIAAGYDVISTPVSMRSEGSRSLDQRNVSTPQSIETLSVASLLQPLASPVYSNHSRDPASLHIISGTSPSVTTSELSTRTGTRSAKLPRPGSKLTDVNEAFLLVHFEKHIGPWVREGRALLI